MDISDHHIPKTLNCKSKKRKEDIYVKIIINKPSEVLDDGKVVMIIICVLLIVSCAVITILK